MPKSTTTYSLLISCPGDIKDEIKIIKEKAEDFNRAFGEINNVKIETKHWSKDSYPESGGKPQELLNKQFIRDCDLAVAIFWTKFGTPTDEYGSGTEEEIELLIKAGKQVFVYFSNSPISPDDIDAQQHERVKKFKESFKSRGIYREYNDIGDFEKMFLNHLNLHFLNVITNHEKGVDSNKAKLLLTEAHIDNKNSQEINFYKSDFLNSEFIETNESIIYNLFKKINNIKLPKPIASSKNNDEKKLNIFSDVIDKSIKPNKELGNTKLPKQNELILDYSRKNDIEINDDFFYTGELIIGKSMYVPGIYIEPPLYGNDDEKEKYNLINELEGAILRINEYILFFSKLDSLYSVDLMLSNSGIRFDEDIDIELKINKDCICRVKDLPIPDGLIIDGDDTNIFYEMLYELSDKMFAENYSSGETFIPQTIPFNPSMNLLRGKSYKDLEDEVATDIQVLYEDYNWYQDETDDIIQLKMGYLKHGKNMLFPSKLFFKEVPKYIKYEIKSKYQTEPTIGELKIIN